MHATFSVNAKAEEKETLPPFPMSKFIFLQNEKRLLTLSRRLAISALIWYGSYLVLAENPENAKQMENSILLFFPPSLIQLLRYGSI